MATIPMTEILVRAEWPDPAFDGAAVAGWPSGAFEQFRELGLLADGGHVTTATCGACDGDHVELVRWERVAGLPPRACIPCPECRLVWLDPNALRRWVVRLPALATAAASSLGATGGLTERTPGRVWKLGTLRAGGRVWVGFLAVGLTRADGAAVVESVPELRAPNALVFVPATVPPVSVWSADRAPVVVALTDLLRLDASGLTADREFLESALPADARPRAKDTTRAFPTPTGTTWEQVALVVEDHHVRVQVGDVVARFGFAEAGFEDGRAANAPDQQWELLQLLARRGGTLGPTDAVNTKPGALKQKVGVLRKRLQAMLALEDDPFHRTRASQPYRARFAIRPDSPLTFPTPPGATWDDITLTETTTGIDIAVPADAHGVAREIADDERASRWVGTVERGEDHRRHTLADLGLADPDGSPTATGAALVELLRAGGRLARPAGAPDLLELGRALSRFFQLDTPPLSFDPKRNVWVARFEAASTVPANGQK